jgi:flavin-dependent dehydrogenase
MRSVDALIVGGGPAGAAAAITLAERGRAVLVVERSDFAGPRVGETLPPAANPLLARLGVLDALEGDGHLRCPGTASAWGSDAVYHEDTLFDPDGDGWHLDRAQFDGALARRAVQAGADVATNTEVRSCRRNGPGWAAEIGGSRGNERLRARALIDAAGRTAWPGRPFGRRSFDRLVALVGAFSREDRSQPDRRTWTESARDGWWYASALPDGGLVAAYFTDSDLVSAGADQRQRHWDALLQDARSTRDRLGGMRQRGELRVVPASSGLAYPLAAGAWFAVGDAAHTLDPLSSQGIVWALTSGIEAAEALLGPNPDEAAESYAARLALRYHDYLDTRRMIYSRERRWPDSVFWMRRTPRAAQDVATWKGRSFRVG